MVRKHMFSILMICLLLGGFLFQFRFWGICTPSYAENLFTDQTDDPLFFTDEAFLETDSVFTDEAMVYAEEEPALYPETEPEETSLSTGKKAWPTSDPDRFRLTLEAGLEGTVRKGVSVILLLDASRSMEENGQFPVLKEAAIDFIHRLAEASPESEAAVIWYSGGEPGMTLRIHPTAWTRLAPENLSFLEAFIEEEDAMGETPMGAVLDAALGMLLQAQFEQRFCILFTDGMPGYLSTVNPGSYQSAFNCGTANLALKAARGIKDPAVGNTVLYTIGYGLEEGQNTAFYFREGDPCSMEAEGHGGHRRIRGTDFLRDMIASGRRHYAVSAEEVLREVFVLLSKQVIRYMGPEITCITDILSPEFELTGACRERLLAEGVQICEEEDGTTAVTWSLPRVGFWEAEEEAWKPWQEELEICARKPCPEGRFPTNTADSAVHTAEGPVYFPVPQVLLTGPQAGALPACGGWAGWIRALGLFWIGGSRIRKKGKP